MRMNEIIYENFIAQLLANGKHSINISYQTKTSADMFFP